MIIFQDSLVTLHLGDSREVLQGLEPESVDLLLTDAPYGVSTGVEPDEFRAAEGRTVDQFTTDRDRVEVSRLVEEVLYRTLPLMSRTASAYWWIGHRDMALLADWYETLGWSTRPMAWHKPDAPPAMPDSGWTSALELCLHAYRPGRTWNHRLAAPHNVFTERVVRDTARHPCQKPLRIMEAQILASSLEGALVLDPFAGSGTTLVAARALGRRAIGVEVEEKFARLAVMRLEQGVLF